MKQNAVRTRSKKLSKTKRDHCPKCGGKMVNGACTKCNYSSKTAYKSRREAMEFTYAAD